MACRLIAKGTLGLISIAVTSSCSPQELTKESCEREFLSQSKKWESEAEEGSFTPIVGAAVEDGEFYVMTWGLDYFPSSVSGSSNHLIFRPAYRAWLKAGRSGDLPGEQVKEYAAGNYVHRIEVDANCSADGDLKIDIVKGEGEVEAVRLRRVK